MSINRTAYTSGHFLLKLDEPASSDLETTWLKSLDGGAVKGSIVEESVGTNNLQLKHLTTVEIEPLTMEVGMSASTPVFKWVTDSVNKEFSRRNGEVIHADFNLKSVLEQSFIDALVSEVTFPTLDGSDKGAAYLTVKILPERIELKKGDGNIIKGVDSQKQKLWTPANFRLDIDTVPSAKYVNKIDSFTIKQKIKPLYVGKSRYPELEPTGVEFPRLNLTIAAAYADEFIDWYDKLVVKGGQDPALQKTGAIEFLDPTTGQDIFTLELKKIGISHLAIEKSDANAEAIKRCKVELFIESMAIATSGAGLA
jgi:hypothetical protein